MKHKVMIMKRKDYDVDKIKSVVLEGIQELGVKPRGKVLMKPNCVMAHKDLFPHAFTRPEFVEGVAAALQKNGSEIQELALGERCGITIPTRFCFGNAGYMEVAKKYGLKVHFFDECKQVPVKLRNPERLRDTIYLPKPITETDFFVNLPKFKAHPWTRLTLSLKNLIGIQDDKYRLIDHNTHLEHKIADLAETVTHGFIAVDGITAGQKMMLTPTPFDLGAIIMGTNPCAVDTVCSHMVNTDPDQIIHLKYAAQRGFGPISLDDIEISGDYPLAEAQSRTAGFEFCMEKIDDYFKYQGKLSCIVGSFPEDHSPDYCWGGCPGALQESMHIIQMYYPEVHKTMGKIKYVVGEVDGPIDLEPDERVIFMGDCTSWRGQIDGEQVVIEKSYRSRCEEDTKNAKTNDMALKILGSVWHCLTNGKKRYIHAPGCPVSVAAHVNYLSFLGGIKNVNFDKRTLIPVNLGYMQMRFNRAINRMLG